MKYENLSTREKIIYLKDLSKRFNSVYQEYRELWKSEYKTTYNIFPSECKTLDNEVDRLLKIFGEEQYKELESKVAP